MSEIDDILGGNNKFVNYTTNRNYNNKRNNNNWVEQQNNDRNEIYGIMDKMALEIVEDSNKFKEYLKIQSRFAKYSVGNCLVLLKTAPNSIQIKDYNSWKEKGIKLKENAKEIKILEPINRNGKIYFNPKVVYDISQTTAQNKNNEISFGDRKLLEALLYKCDVPRKAIDKLEDGTVGALYNQNENILYVCKGMEREILFQTLSQSLGDIELKGEKDSNLKRFKTYCVSYMICNRYGIDVSNFNFEKLPYEITSLKKPKVIRAEIEKIRKSFENIHLRMSEYFEKNNKEKSKLAPER